jgi:hypothetical protein
MAGGISVRFSATDSGFTSTVSKVNSSMKGMDDNTRKVSGSIKSSFASMAKAGAALAVGFGAIKVALNAVRGTLDNFKEALDMGSELSDLAARTGETAGNLMVLRRAFDNSGAGADKVGATINKLQRAMVEAGAGSKTYEEAFSKLGLNLEQLKYAAPTEQLKAVADALQKIENPTERSALAMQLLGRSGGELLPLLMNMTGELQNAQAELGSLPGVMDRSANAFDSISDKLNVMKGKLTEFAAGMLESAIPALNQFVNAGSELDSAGFGRAIGQRLSEAFDLITSGDMWEIFKLRGESAINSLRTSGAINGLAAAINATLDFGLSESMGGSQNWKESFDKYKKYGIEANTDIADSLDDRISGIMERSAERLAEAARKIDQETAERAAMSGIMLKDIKQKEGFSTTIPDTLKRVTDGLKKDFDFMKANSGSIARDFEVAAQSAEKSKMLADEVWQSIEDFKQREKIDPGGKLQNKVQEELAKGNRRGAERAANKIDERERERNIQDAFVGGDSKIKKSLQEIAKEQGIDTKGKRRSDLRKELEELMKKREEEMKPGKEGKNKNQVDPPPKAADPMAKISQAVDEIKRLIAKIEPKLPTAALGA